MYRILTSCMSQHFKQTSESRARSQQADENTGSWVPPSMITCYIKRNLFTPTPHSDAPLSPRQRVIYWDFPLFPLPLTFTMKAHYFTPRSQSMTINTQQMCATTAGCVLLRNRLRIRADGHQRSVPPIPHLTKSLLFTTSLHWNAARKVNPSIFLLIQWGSRRGVEPPPGDIRYKYTQTGWQWLIDRKAFTEDDLSTFEYHAICFGNLCGILSWLSSIFNFNFLLPLEQKCALWGHSGLGTDTRSLLTAEMLSQSQVKPKKLHLSPRGN